MCTWILNVNVCLTYACQHMVHISPSVSLRPSSPSSPHSFFSSVKAGGKRVATKHKHEETDPDAYDQKYVDALPEPQ